jgi:hypothetical protein
MQECLRSLAYASVIGAVTLTVTAAAAVPVKPSGKYVFTSTESCEAKFVFTTRTYTTPTGTDTGVKIINSVINGSIGATVGIVSLTPTSASGGNFAIKQTDVNGGSLRINNGGFNVQVTSGSTTGTYTFSANSISFVLPDETATFTFAYGQLPASGIPTSIHLVRKHASGETANCVESMILTK